MITTVVLVSVAVVVFAWLMLRPEPAPRPIVYTTTGGATVTAHQTRSPENVWRWECSGCDTTATGAVGEDLRPAANQHAIDCRARPHSLEAGAD